MGHAMHSLTVIFTDGSANASDSTSENGDYEEACSRSTRKSGELSHNKKSSNNDKSGRNLHKHERSKSMKDDTDSVLEAKSRKVQKISPTSDTSPAHPPHKKAKRSKSKRKRKQKSAYRCGSPEHYGKKRARSPDDPKLVISPRISSIKRQREERAIVQSSVLGSIIKPQMSQGKEHHKREKYHSMMESESVMHPRRHISHTSPHGRERLPAGG